MKKMTCYIGTIFLMTLLLIPSTLGNPAFPALDPGSPGNPEDDSTYQNMTGFYQMDPNRGDLIFSYEFVNIVIEDPPSLSGQLNATYILENPRDLWINQTVAIPGWGSAIENKTIFEVDGISQDWFLDYISIEDGTIASNPVDYQPHYHCALLNISFPPHTQRVISASYGLMLSSSYRDWGGTIGNLTVEYLVTTGVNWNETIGSATVVFSFANANISQISDSGYYVPTYQNNSDYTIMKWQFSNWTPVEEIRVAFIPNDWPLYIYSDNTQINGIVNENVTFTVSSTFNNIPLNSGMYYYDFGDSCILNWTYQNNLDTVNHTYNQTGEYEVKIWVWDYDNGMISEEPVIIMVTIQEKSSSNGLAVILIIALVIIISILIFIKFIRKVSG